MRGHATGRGGIGWSKDHTKARAILNSLYGLPPFLGMDRGAGSWSRQTAPAVDGTTFITLGTAEDEPRWDYGGGLEGLLIEPTRTNDLLNPNFVDVAPANNVPDGWGSLGTAGTDFVTAAAGPHGGTILTLKSGCGNLEGPYLPGYGLPAVDTIHACSVWARATGLAAGRELYAIGLSAGVTAKIALATGTFDWTRHSAVVTTGNPTVDAARYMLMSASALAQDVSLCLPQIEVGDCVSSFSAATRAAELLTIDPTLVGRHRGAVLGLSRFDFPSTQALTVDPVICCWADGYKLVYDPADDKCKVVVAGTKRAASAALTFARQSWIGWRVDYGAAGQKLTLSVNGGAATEYTDSTAWGDPGVLAPYLGSDAASANCRPMAHARIESAWY